MTAELKPAPLPAYVPMTDKEIEDIRQRPEHHKGEFEYRFLEAVFARSVERTVLARLGVGS